jgi:hypothetical protein
MLTLRSLRAPRWIALARLGGAVAWPCTVQSFPDPRRPSGRGSEYVLIEPVLGSEASPRLNGLGLELAFPRERGHARAEISQRGLF